MNIKPHPRTGAAGSVRRVQIMKIGCEKGCLIRTVAIRPPDESRGEALSP